MKFPSLYFFIFMYLGLTAQSNENLYSLALENIEKKQYKKALSNIEKALEKEKNDKYIITKIEVLNYLKTEPKEILIFLNDQIKDNPSPVLLIERGYGYERLYRFQDAILDYSEAIKQTKEDTVLLRALDSRGGLYQRIRKPELAKIDYKKAYELDSNDISVCNNFSIVLDELGEIERAKYLLLKIAEKDSTNIPALMNLGFFASEHEEYEEALIYLNKALDLEPEGAYTLSNISFVKLKLGLPKEALKDVNKSISLYKENSYAYKNRALIYLALNKKNDACKDLKTALEYGYSEFYGPEVNELIKTNCIE